MTAIDLAFFEAYTLGIISPNNNIKDVTTNTLRMKAAIGLTARLNIIFMMYVENIVMDILTKLLAINIVTRRVLGFWRISNTNCSLRFEDDSSSLMSLGCNEKKAVSLEEAIAEHKSNPHINIKQNTTFTEMPMKNGSAVMVVSRHIRGSIEDISKIIYFTISGAKIRKKSISQKLTSQ